MRNRAYPWALPRVWALPLLAVLTLSGCSFFDSDEEKVPGKREVAFTYQRDGDIRSTEFVPQLPPPTLIADWGQAGGSPSHRGFNAELANGSVEGGEGRLRTIWRKDAGDKASSEQILVGSVVIGGGKVFAIDGEPYVSAFEMKKGQRVWRTELVGDQDDEFAPIGGALAFADGRVFALNGKRSIFALDAQSGKILWQRKFKVPLKGSPTVAADKVFTMAADNRLFALNVADGEELWSHIGLVENIFFVGNVAAAVSGDAVVVAYSSGELFALGIENGFELWRNDLSPGGFRADPSKLFFDIVVPPVVVDKTVYITTRGADTLAIDLATGDEEWRISLESSELPWVVGNAMFLLTLEGELLCLDKQNGDFLWRVTLPKQGDEDDDEYQPWHGPILVENKLLVVNNNGLGQFRNPADGSQMGDDFDLGDEILAAPSVADGRLYFLTADVGLLTLE